LATRNRRDVDAQRRLAYRVRRRVSDDATPAFTRDQNSRSCPNNCPRTDQL